MKQTDNIELSIITINYNNCVGLERTIRSVIEQITIFLGNCTIDFFTEQVSENEPWGISAR